MISMWTIIALPLVEAIVVGALCGLVGSLAVLSQRIFFTESITHAAFPGAVIGVVGAALVSSSHEALSLGLFIGAGLASLVLALLMHGVSALKGISSQAAAGITLTVGFASGYFLNKWFAPLPLRIDGFLTGSLLACTRIDVIAAALVLIVAGGVWALMGGWLVAVSFDAVNYRASGGRPDLMRLITLGLIIATVTVIIPAVGTVVSISLIAAAPTVLKGRVASTPRFVALSTLASTIIAVVGLGLAVVCGLSAGGTIALVAGGFFVIVEAGSRIASSKLASAI